MAETYRSRIAAAFVALLVAGVASAQEKPRESGGTVGGSSAEDVRREDATVKLDVKDFPLVDILRLLSDVSGINIVPDTDIEDRVTVVLNDVPWREALDILCQRTKTIYKEISPRVIRVMKPPRVTADFRNSPLVEIIDILANKAGANIVIAPDVDPKIRITMRFQNIPWEAALDALVRTAGYASVLEPSGIIRIVSPDKLATQMETRVFELKYLRPQDVYRPVIKAAELIVSQVTAVSDPLKDFTIIEALTSSLSRKGTAVIGSLRYIQSQNSFIVNDTRPVLDAMQKIIDRLDVEPFQVNLEVKLVTTRNADLAQIGLLYTTGNQRGIAIGSSTLFVPNKPYVTDATGLAPAATSTIRRSRLPFGLGHDFIGTDTFFATNFGITATLRLFMQDTDTRIEQAPSLSVLSDAEATIFVGEAVRWAEIDTAATQSGGSTSSLKEAEDSPVQIGFQLLVIPHVIRGTNKIVMTVIPQTNTLTGSSTILPGFDEFQLIGDASVEGGGTQRIFLPRVATSTVVTRMLVESGNTAVVGGLIEDRDTVIIDKMPLLGDIPIVGHLFRHTDRNKSKNHLIVFITPRLVRSSGETITTASAKLDNRKAEERSEHERLKEGVSKGDWEERMKKQREEEAKEHERLKNQK